MRRRHSSSADAGVLPEPAEMLVRGRDRRVRLVERRQRLLGGILSGGLLSQCAGQRGRQLMRLRLGGGEFATGVLDLGRDLERARPAV